jgi:hypothetical protein
MISSYEALERQHRDDRLRREVFEQRDFLIGIRPDLSSLCANISEEGAAGGEPRGKVARAEPIAALYEQSRVLHLGCFPQLEDEMTAFTTNFDRKTAGFSPGRVDSLVWALTDLLTQPMGVLGHLRALQARSTRLADLGPRGGNGRHRRTRPATTARERHPDRTAALRRLDGGPAGDAGRGCRARRGDRRNHNRETLMLDADPRDRRSRQGLLWPRVNNS